MPGPDRAARFATIISESDEPSQFVGVRREQYRQGQDARHNQNQEPLKSVSNVV